MSPDIAYSPKREDVLSPCENAQFFPAGLSQSNAALCVAISQLAYCQHRHSPSTKQNFRGSRVRGVHAMPSFLRREALTAYWRSAPESPPGSTATQSLTWDHLRHEFGIMRRNPVLYTFEKGLRLSENLLRFGLCSYRRAIVVDGIPLAPARLEEIERMSG